MKDPNDAWLKPLVGGRGRILPNCGAYPLGRIQLGLEVLKNFNRGVGHFQWRC